METSSFTALRSLTLELSELQFMGFVVVAEGEAGVKILSEEWLLRIFDVL